MTKKLIQSFNPKFHGFSFTNSWEWNSKEKTQIWSLSFVFSIFLLIALSGSVFGLNFGICLIILLNLKLKNLLRQNYGLCGGMVLASQQRFVKGKFLNRKLRQNCNLLRRYLWKKQLLSLWKGLFKLLNWRIIDLFVSRKQLLKKSEIEFQRLKKMIDNDLLCPLILIDESRNMFNDHQVLAYGYEQNEKNYSVFVYDVNEPNIEHIIEADLAKFEFMFYGQKQFKKKIKAFFVNF